MHTILNVKGKPEILHIYLCSLQMGLSLIIVPPNNTFSGYLEVSLKPVVLINKCNSQMSFQLIRRS